MTQKDDATGGNERLINRRNVLSLTGSAAAAALLGVGTASAQTTPSKYMLLDTTDTSSPCHYVVEASEAIEVVPTDANTVSDTSDTRVEGTVDQGYVAIKYAGWISTIEIDGRAYVSFGDSAKDKFPVTGHEIVITSPTEVDYTFTATEDIERVEDGSKMAAETNNDSITQHDDGTYAASGYTGNGYGDSFDVTGDVSSFSPMEGDFTLTYDGQEVTAYELTGQEPPANDGPVIGGGDGYANTVPESEADVVVSTKSELNSALLDAASGDVVYLSGDADIDMGLSEFTVPQGVTLASDRGIDGSSGGRIKTGDRPWPMLTLQDHVRLTGLRVGGPRWNWTEYGNMELGIEVEGNNVEIDNVEAYGWAYAAMRVNDDTHVHHNSIHHNSMKGVGYGVATVKSENPIIEYNEFSHNRHSVEGTGNGGYTARYNHVKEHAIGHVFDQHRPGGGTIKIYNNTVEPLYNEKPEKDKKVPAVAIRGVPDDVVDVHDNWFHNPEKPLSTPNDWTDEAIIQVHTSSWQNVQFSNNHYGSSEPSSSDVGCPR